ncbi:MAG: chorismate synthase [Chlamydiota bacterium]
MTTWGESHGSAVGVVIDGCPSGLLLSKEDIQKQLFFRMSGKEYTSPRQETDMVEILSGVFEGKTTGMPIFLLIRNVDGKKEDYEDQQYIIKPGHAAFTYLEKYGIFDYFGGGRASARETVCRVAAGAIAKKILEHFGIFVLAFVRSVGDLCIPYVNCEDPKTLDLLRKKSPILCPDETTSHQILQALEKIQQERDSIGGVVEAFAYHLPVGLGDPVYEKLSSNLAKALFSIPAVKGLEIGDGFQSARQKGSEHNDRFCIRDQEIALESNHCGGMLGGISTQGPLHVKVAFKPTPTIGKVQKTVTTEKNEIEHSFQGRHDPCVAIRAVVVVESMIQLVLVDALLLQRCSRL